MVVRDRQPEQSRQDLEDGPGLAPRAPVREVVREPGRLVQDALREPLVQSHGDNVPLPEGMEFGISDLVVVLGVVAIVIGVRFLLRRPPDDEG